MTSQQSQPEPGTEETPWGHEEQMLRSLWAVTLSLDVDTIGRHDSFIRLGGNSITAMRLVSSARQAGLPLTVEIVLQNPILSEQAQILVLGNHVNGEGGLRESTLVHLSSEVPRFSLLGVDSDSRNKIVQEAAKQCNIHIDHIDDVYSCTPMQEGLFALTMRTPSAYTARHLFRLPSHVDDGLFKAAWDTVLDANNILRTRIVQSTSQGLLYQAVLRHHGILWEWHDHLEDYLEEGQGQPMQLGAPLIRLAIAHSDSLERYCVVTIHHAIYDRYSMDLILKQVQGAYGGRQIESTPFNPFVQYVSQLSSAAKDFWHTQLNDFEGPVFPSLPSSDYVPLPTASETTTIPLALQGSDDFTLSTKIRLAWAITMSHYTGADDVVFGATVSGRAASVPGVDKMTGPTIATVPQRVQLSQTERSIGDVLADLQDSSTRAIPFEQLGLRRISELGPGTRLACQFQSLLVIQGRQEVDENSSDLMLAEKGSRDFEAAGFGTYGLILCCEENNENSLIVRAIFDDGILPAQQAKRVLDHFASVLKHIIGDASGPIAGVSSISPQDMIKLREWNSSLPNSVDSLVHELIYQQRKVRSEDPAVCAWDGSLTYHELDDLSSKLAIHLINHYGIAPEIFVPLYFEKSKWAIVTMLAVMKAGGAFTLLETSYPLSRLQEICEQVGASVVLTSEQNATRALSLTGVQVIVIGEHAMKELGANTHYHDLSDSLSARGMKPVTANNALYAVFTSGSTGNPKGVIITHGSYAASARARQVAARFDSDSRVLNFSSYAFDTSIHETIGTLVAGGCICVPSEEMRKDNLSKAINELQCNHLVLTPTVARLLKPSQLTSVTNMSLGGEPVRQSDIEYWQGHLILTIEYGPSECSVSSTFQQVSSKNDANMIGRGEAGVCWVVNPTDHDRLMPVGSIGELLIEGPIVGRGYLNDPEKTHASFIQSPPWLSEFRSDKEKTRLYKTGDLVQYAAEDGRLRYIGRKDAQVKLHGQRFELGEVEQHARRAFNEDCDGADVEDLVAELVSPSNFNSDGKSTAILGIFARISVSQEIIAESSKERLSDYALGYSSPNFRRMVQNVQSTLLQRLPSFMVPSVFVPMRALPVSVTGKVNRKGLRDICSRVSREELMASAGVSATKGRSPDTDMERTLYSLTKEISKAQDFGLDDHFFRLGGDSVVAMQLVGMAREIGIHLEVADIFKFPVLADLARLMETRKTTNMNGMQSPYVNQQSTPFALLRDNQVREDAIESARRSCGISREDVEDVEDIYPCTPLQEGLFALTLKHSSRGGNNNLFTTRQVFELPQNLDIERLRYSWEAVVRSNQILRTRVIPGAEQPLQLVLQASSSPVPWEDWEDNDLDTYLDQDYKKCMQFGDALVRCAHVKNQQSGSHNYFVLTMHHAVYDAWTMPLLLRQVESMYSEEQLVPTTPFTSFITYLQGLDVKESENFWRSSFENIEAPQFPELPSSGDIPKPTAYLKRSIGFDSLETIDVTPTTLVRFAWALTLSEYTNSLDVLYGLTVSGRDVPLSGIEKVAGPTIATFPLRVQLQGSSTVEEALLQIQDYITQSVPFQHLGLQKISSVSREAASACQFGSLLIVQPASQNVLSSGLFLGNHQPPARNSEDTFDNNALTVICELDNDAHVFNLEAFYDPEIIPERQMTWVMEQFAFHLEQLRHQPKAKVKDILGANPRHKEQLYFWNSSVPAGINSCVHDLIAVHSIARPSSEAVAAWDGKFTHRELDDLSSHLAAELTTQNAIEPGVFVPLCFEKSKWTIVAILAVMKAGGAFMLLDPSQPLKRLKGLCHQLDARIALSSVQNLPLMKDIGLPAICLSDADTACSAVCGSHTIQSSVCPSDPLYIIFTSGSTGTPKGTIIEHVALATNAFQYGRLQHYDSQSRVLQFSSYTFDNSFAEILYTLICGGCVCVPVDDERMDIVQEVARYNVNLASLTPSLARAVDPKEVPSLRTLLLGGEAVQPIDLNMWAKNVRCINGYGPAECAVDCTISAIIKPDSNPRNIGWSNGAVCWVVDPDDIEKLMPIGSVGELLVEGAIVGRGYLNEPEKTAASFIKPPAWLARLRGSDIRRLYRTGDLVQYSPDGDGSLLYVGRKDNQVKLRGQRIELGEVEYHLRECFPSARDVVAEVITSADEGAHPVLTAFLYFGDTESVDEDIIFTEVVEFQTQVQEAEPSLRSRLPSYMVPDLFLPLSVLPLSSSGKMDRRLLREKASELPRGKLQSYGTPQKKRRAPSTAMEKLLQNLVGNVLRLDLDDIGMGDSFVHLGGDSISALRLVGQGRKNTVSFSVADVFQYKRLSALAEVMKDNKAADKLVEVEPFSQIQLNEKRSPNIVDSVARECGVDSDQIEDIYPCLPMQEALFALSMKQLGAYTARFSFGLAEDIDIDRFKHAWDAVLRANPVLRTRIISDTHHGSFQVVIRGSNGWNSTLDSPPNATLPISFGCPLVRFGLTQNTVTASHRHRFDVMIHHALYDDWSLQSIFEQLEAAYRGQPLELRPFSPFVKYVSNIDATEVARFWEAELSNVQAPVFPTIPSTDYVPGCMRSLQHQVHPFQLNQETSVTLSALLKVAWGLTLGQFTGSNEALFGTVVNGRSAPLTGVEQITGPTITTVPTRISFQYDQDVQSLLEGAHQQSIRMIAFEQTGLQKIRELTSGPGCDFQNILVIQCLESEQRDETSSAGSLFTIDPAADGEDMAAFGTYPLTLLCRQSKDSLHFEAIYDEKLLPEAQMERILHQLDHNLCELNMVSTDTGRLLSDLSDINPLDQKQLQLWNGTLPETASHCVHDLIAAKILEQPKAQAVCSWDGEFTYAQLDELSWRFASEIMSRGVGLGDVVPIYFAKSKWTPVLVIAAMRAGGAFLLLDTAHPKERLYGICQSVNAKIVLCWHSDSDEVQDFAPQVISIDTTDELPSEANSAKELSPARRNITPQDLLYVVLTSGSTGKPKGVMVPHQAFCSMAIPFIQASGLGSGTRAFSFSAYAWDVSVQDILVPLLAGGCICVPSEADRTGNLPKAINELKANFAPLTPVVLRTLRPEDFPTLTAVMVGGESLSKDDFPVWIRQGIRFFQAYGPAECSVISTRVTMTEVSDPANIGKPIASCMWIVDPSDHKRLVPIGATGELLIEGPIVASGYYNNPEQTSAVFIDSLPQWLRQYRGLDGKNKSRLYKTGDLVMYSSDGSIRFVGRKDNQVKIRGQRIDPGEVENQVQKSFAESIDVIVEVVKPAGDDTRPLLVAFLRTSSISETSSTFEGSGEKGQILAFSSDSFREEVGAAKARLHAALPRYMVPEAFVPINYIPCNSVGKVDRRLLRDLAGQLRRNELAMASNITVTAGTMQAPTSEAQRAVQGLFSDIFTPPRESISVSDDFFELGGDSIMAMRLVANARRKGISVTVADVLSHPILSDLAGTIDMMESCSSGEVKEPIAPFSLLGAEESIKPDALKLAAEQCGIPEEHVEDIYPCTPLQEGLMALSLGKPGAYVAYHEFKLAENIDLDLWRAAWKATVTANPILRTRIIQTDRSLQVVLKDGFQWDWVVQSEDSINSRANSVRLPETRFGGPLLYLAAEKSITRNQPHRFFLAIHHALYDGWSWVSVFRQVHQAYLGRSLQSSPFNPFVKYLLNLDSESVRAYWLAELKELDASPFPSLPSSKHIPSPTGVIEHTVTMGSVAGFTSTTAIRLAWAILLSQYTKSNDVVFGVTLSGRDTPVAGIDSTTGPTLATVPFRVCLKSEATIYKTLQNVQKQYLNMIPFQHFGLQNISKLGSKAETACAFQNLLVIQPPESGQPTDELLMLDEDGDKDTGGEFRTYAIVLKCQLSLESQVRIQMNFDPKVIAQEEAQRMLFQLSHIMSELQRNTQSVLKDIDHLSPHDISQLQEWNNPAALMRRDDCAYRIFQEQYRKHTKDPAVCSWDGEFTYEELEQASSLLASHLRELGAGPEVFIPICLPKSRWTVVTILGIMKARSAFVLIDPSIPLLRRQAICSEIGATIVVSSQRQIRDCHGLATTVVSISNEEMSWQNAVCDTNHSFVLAEAVDSLYATFTSGSTGKPKGVVIHNAAFCSFIHPYLTKVGLTSRSRVLQFVSYAFDPSISDMLATLLAGGCVCIPSDDERRNDLPGAIKRLEANWVNLTPSIIRAWLPESFPTIKTVVSGGEALSRQDIETWGKKVKLIVSYGPAECCIKSVLQPMTDIADPLNIGHPLAAECWAVDPSDCKRLMPVGTVGELVIGGPMVGRGYINNPDATSRAFISASSFSWRKRFENYDPNGRLYLTGDLVKFTGNGTLRFAGRKDTQIKIRGQRVELNDIEQNIRQCFPLSNQVTVELVESRRDDQSQAALVAFVALEHANCASLGCRTLAENDLFTIPCRELRLHIVRVEEDLQKLLPSYMIPSLFFILRKFPFTTSGKTDRRRLREEASSLSIDQVKMYAAADEPKRLPTTFEEEVARQICAQVLQIKLQSIGMNDSFFHLGGDSISALKFTSLAREKGLNFRVADVFSHPRLSELAAVSGLADSSQQNGTAEAPGPEVTAHSYLGFTCREDLIADASRSPLLRANSVQDVFPATNGQIVRLYEENRHFIFRMEGSINRVKLESAIRSLIQRHDILRVVFQPYMETVRQVVLKNADDIPIIFLETKQDMGRYVEHLCFSDEVPIPPFNNPVTQFTIVKGAPKRHDLIMRLSHAQYDGFSRSNLSRELKALYEGQQLPEPVSYAAHTRRWLRHKHDEDALRFWRNYLQGSNITDLRELSMSDEKNGACEPRLLDSTRHLRPVHLPEGITLATIVNAAWSIVLSLLMKRTDIVFGFTTTGRNSETLENTNALGLCLNRIPVRARLSDPSLTVLDLLRDLQKTYRESMKYELVEISDILQVPPPSPGTELFGSVLIFQNSSDSAPFTIGGAACTWDYYGNFPKRNYVMVEAAPSETDLSISIATPSTILSKRTMEIMLDKMEETIPLLVRSLGRKISEIGVGAEQANGMNGFH